MHATLIIAARRARDSLGPSLDIRELSDPCSRHVGCRIRNCRAERRAFAERRTDLGEARKTGPREQVRWRPARTDLCRRAEMPRASAVPRPGRAFGPRNVPRRRRAPGRHGGCVAARAMLRITDVVDTRSDGRATWTLKVEGTLDGRMASGAAACLASCARGGGRSGDPRPSRGRPLRRCGREGAAGRHVPCRRRHRRARLPDRRDPRRHRPPRGSRSTRPRNDTPAVSAGGPSRSGTGPGHWTRRPQSTTPLEPSDRHQRWGHENGRRSVDTGENEASSVSTTDGLPLADRFQALVSVAESITSCREPEDLFRRLAAELERVVRFDFVAFVLYDPERGVVRGDLLDARSMALAPRPEAASGRVAGGLGGPDAAAARRPRHVRRNTIQRDDAHPAGRHRELLPAPADDGPQTGRGARIRASPACGVPRRRGAVLGRGGEARRGRDRERDGLSGDRAAQGQAGRRAALPRERDPDRAHVRAHRRRESRASSDAPAGGDRRPDRLDGAPARRDGDGQGAARAGHPRSKRPARPHVREAQLRRHSVGTPGERALRPREGRLHRRDRPEDRTVPGGRRRHALPRRSGRDPARAPAEAPPGAAGAGIRADRRHEDRQGGRADHRGDEPRSPPDGRSSSASGTTSTTG